MPRRRWSGRSKRWGRKPRSTRTVRGRPRTRAACYPEHGQLRQRHWRRRHWRRLGAERRQSAWRPPAGHGATPSSGQNNEWLINRSHDKGSFVGGDSKDQVGFVGDSQATAAARSARPSITSDCNGRPTPPPPIRPCPRAAERSDDPRLHLGFDYGRPATGAVNSTLARRLEASSSISGRSNLGIGGSADGHSAGRGCLRTGSTFGRTVVALRAGNLFGAEPSDGKGSCSAVELLGRAGAAEVADEFGRAATPAAALGCGRPPLDHPLAAKAGHVDRGGNHGRARRGTRGRHVIRHRLHAGILRRADGRRRLPLQTGGTCRQLVCRLARLDGTPGGSVLWRISILEAVSDLPTAPAANGATDWRAPSRHCASRSATEA